MSNLTLQQYKKYRELEKRVESRRIELINEQLNHPPEDTTPEERKQLIENTLRKEFPEWYEDEDTGGTPVNEP